MKNIGFEFRGKFRELDQVLMEQLEYQLNITLYKKLGEQLGDSTLDPLFEQFDMLLGRQFKLIIKFYVL